ncbi:MAG TPA: alpha/beta hydrolase [bacterium]|nr:alpha/beta hydrolase [bacterium]
MKTRVYWAILIALTLGAWPTGPAEASGSNGFPLQKHSALATCRAFLVPVNVEPVGNTEIYGELCVPRGGSPETVQFLVHGTSYNHHYWDWPYKPEKYSHVREALKRGYATFNVDRLGTGLSGKPNSELIFADTVIEAFHQVITKLRSGELGGRAFSKVVYFGSSLSTALGWLLGSQHPEDVDAFVLTGLIHLTRPGFLEMVAKWHIDPACEAFPWKYMGIDCGYIVTHPWTKDDFYHYEPNVEPINVALDELLKDIASSTLTFDTAQYVGVFAPPPVPEGAPSRDIHVPVLAVFPEFDETGCGPDALTCTEENVYNFEAPFYDPDAELEVYVPLATGHAMTIHDNALETTGVIHDWMEEKLN